MANQGNEASGYKTTSFRAKASLVDAARRIFEAHNMSVSAAITLFLEECVRQGRIPECITDPGQGAPNHATTELLLRSIADGLRLSDYGDPTIPAENFVRDIVLEIKRSILAGGHGPWTDLGMKVARLAFWSLEDPWCQTCDCEDCELCELAYDILDNFIPDKFPYDYAEEIVSNEIKTWVRAERNADSDIESPLNVIMGRSLKRSRLTLDALMNELVEEGIVDSKDGPTFNRSLGKMAEDMVDYMKKSGYWNTPESSYGVPFLRIEEDLVDQVVARTALRCANVDYACYLSCEHPVSSLFLDITCEMNGSIENRYCALYKGHDWVDWFALEDRVFCACDFRNPPKAVYDESARRFFGIVESAEPGSMAAKCLPYAKEPFDYEEDLLYSEATDMDVSLWLDLYNREIFYKISDAVLFEELPEPGTTEE